MLEEGRVHKPGKIPSWSAVRNPNTARQSQLRLENDLPLDIIQRCLTRNIVPATRCCSCWLFWPPRYVYWHRTSDHKLMLAGRSRVCGSRRLQAQYEPNACCSPHTRHTCNFVSWRFLGVVEESAGQSRVAKVERICSTKLSTWIMRACDP